MESRWYIDALDVRAGRAFASLRGAVSEHTTSIDNFEGTYFIAAPYFSPELLADATLALAATRGSYQQGVYDEEGEVPFNSLGEIIDFVRRLYLNGGGTAPDGGGPPPAPDGGEGPPGGMYLEAREGVEASSAEAQDIVQKLASLDTNLLYFRSDIANCKRGDSVETSFSEARALTSPRPDTFHPSYLLGRIYSELWLELLGRIPRGSDPKAWAAWIDSLFTLNEIGIELRLFHWYAFTGVGKSIAENVENITDSYVRSHNIELAETINRQTNSIFWAFAFKYFRETPAYIEYRYWYRYPERLFESLARRGNHLQSHIELGLIPVPKIATQNMNFGTIKSEQASLLNFLMLVCSKPDQVQTSATGNATKAKLDLLILAASLIVMEPKITRRFSYLGGPDAQLDLEVFHAGIVSEALNWLHDNLPKHAFNGALEEMIDQAKSLIYSA